MRSVLAVACFLVACAAEGQTVPTGTGDAPPQGLELSGSTAEQLEQALAAIEGAQVIDLGTPAAREYLSAGWSKDEQTPTGQTFVWALGERAVLDLPVAVPEDRWVRFAGRSVTVPEGQVQRVAVSIDGVVLAEVPVSVEGTEFSVRVPGTLLHVGLNQLELRHSFVRSFEESGGDPRPLTVAWDTVSVEPIPAQ